MNSTATTPTADMGLDGSGTAYTTAQDAYGYNLYYYNTDYKPIGTTLPFAKTLQTTSMLRQLYNGNIAGSSLNIPQLTGAAYWIDRTYSYDQLNRIKSATAYHTTGVTATPVHNGDYDEQFTYDGNGNILSVNRAGAGTGTLKDIVSYAYNRNAAGRLLNNELNYLNGHAGASNITPDQAVNNYAYDPIGDLTADVQAGITGIGWNVYGKITNINKATGNLAYTYNPAGQRVSKTLNGLTTYYIRDAQGNTLALYDNAGSAINWREQHLYGSSRLGMWTPNVNLSTGNAIISWDTTGRKQYELNNHLGNVQLTITDKRLQHSSGSGIDYYLADIATAQDYYAFGSLQPGRQYTFNNVYRYGFNGKENDNDVGKGTGNQQDYGMRVLDTRGGRFFSIDPLQVKYPELSSYQFAGDNPIIFIDLNGEEPQIPLIEKFKYGDNIAINVIDVVDNSASDLVNGGISLINSSIGLGHELIFHPKQLPHEFKQGGVDLYNAAKSYASNSYKNFAKTSFKQQLKETTKALKDPSTYEQTLVFGSSLYTGGEGAGAALSDENVYYSIFDQNKFDRGLDIEGVLGGNLPKNFPIIDKFDFTTGLATSIKSVDLTAPGYQNASNLLSRLKGYVNSVAKFDGKTFNGVQIRPGETLGRELDIAIQEGKASASQLNVLKQIRDYGTQNNVDIKIFTFK